jgi:hypothetical protein
MEVGTLSRRVIIDPYPPDYRAALAFSILLYPPPLGFVSRLTFLIGEGDGLTTFRNFALMGYCF